MSFSTGPGMSYGTRMGSQAAVLRGSSLASMAQGVGIIVAAAILAAVYHLVQEETRTVIHNLRARSRYRRARHEGLLLGTLGSQLPVVIQDRLLYSRDAFRVALVLLADPTVNDLDKAILRDVLQRIHGSREE